MSEKQSENSSLFTVKDYLIVNAIFMFFCALQLLFIKIFVKDLAGVLFFFAVLIVGFMIVSVFDYVCDRSSRQNTQAKKEN